MSQVLAGPAMAFSAPSTASSSESEWTMEIALLDDDPEDSCLRLRGAWGVLLARLRPSDSESLFARRFEPKQIEI